MKFRFKKNIQIEHKDRRIGSCVGRGREPYKEDTIGGQGSQMGVNINKVSDV